MNRTGSPVLTEQFSSEYIVLLSLSEKTIQKSCPGCPRIGSDSESTGYTNWLGVYNTCCALTVKKNKNDPNTHKIVKTLRFIVKKLYVNKIYP